jgi:hypothetical protein
MRMKRLAVIPAAALVAVSLARASEDDASFPCADLPPFLRKFSCVDVVLP